MSRWFRLYDELLDDPKVQRLSGEDFKAWVNILCLSSRHAGVLPATKDIAFALRVDPRKGAAIVARLVDAGLIDSSEGALSPHGWTVRQYKSDVSTDRVKQFRQRKKTVAGNGNETFHATPPDTEADTDTPLSKDNGRAPIDEDAQFWSDAKDYLVRRGVKNPGAMVGKWVRDHGKGDTASALTQAQLERPAEIIPFIEGCFRKTVNNGYGAGHSGVPL